MLSLSCYQKSPIMNEYQHLHLHFLLHECFKSKLTHAQQLYMWTPGTVNTVCLGFSSVQSVTVLSMVFGEDYGFWWQRQRIFGEDYGFLVKITDFFLLSIDGFMSRSPDIINMAVFWSKRSSKNHCSQWEPFGILSIFLIILQNPLLGSSDHM